MKDDGSGLGSVIKQILVWSKVSWAPTCAAVFYIYATTGTSNKSIWI
jgi:hypothetical protein